MVMEVDVEARDVSDPLKHLFSLDFSRTSPLLDEISRTVDETLDNQSKRVKKKVWFADPFAKDVPNHIQNSYSNDSKPKGILKKKLSLEESEYALRNLNLDDSYKDECSDFSSVDSSSVEENEEVLDSDLVELGCENIPFEETYQHIKTADTYNESETTSYLVNRDKSQTNLSTCTHSSYNTSRESLVSVPNSDNMLNSREEENSLMMQETCRQPQSPTGSETPLKSHLTREISINSSPSSAVENHDMDASCNVKSGSDKVVTRHKYLKLSHEGIKKPKLHFCDTSLFKQDSEQSKVREPWFLEGSCQNSRACDINTTSSIQRLKKRGFHEFMSSDSSFSLSHQTVKLQSLLNENNMDVSSAKELKSNVFDAWQEIKKEEMLENSKNSKCSDVLNENKKTVNPKVPTKGYLYWKKRYELNLKNKKRSFPKPVMPSSCVQNLSEEEKKKKEEEKFLEKY